MLRLNQIFLLLFLSTSSPFGLALASSEKGGMPQLNPASFDSQIFWLIIIFSLLFLLVNYIFLPKISGIKRNREELINYNLNLAEENNLKVKKINEEISILIEKSKIESEKLIKDCHESNMNNLNTELQKVINQLDQKEKENSTQFVWSHFSNGSSSAHSRTGFRIFTTHRVLFMTFIPSKTSEYFPRPILRITS